MVATKGFSVQMACRTVELSRSSYYYAPMENSFEQRLIENLFALAKRYPRYGYEMMTAKLRQQGWLVNKKRIQRLWRQEGLRVAQTGKKRRRIGKSTCAKQEALFANHVWSWDLLFDRTEDGRSLKILNIVDEFSRFSIALDV